MPISDERFVAITTSRKNGESSSTPVWIADLGDGTIGFTTPGTSLKVGRIRNDPRVLVQPCDRRGTPSSGSEPAAGTADLVVGDDFERVLAAIRRKYGWQVVLVRVIGQVAKLFGQNRLSDTGVVITLDRPSGPAGLEL